MSFNEGSYVRCVDNKHGIEPALIEGAVYRVTHIRSGDNIRVEPPPSNAASDYLAGWRFIPWVPQVGDRIICKNDDPKDGMHYVLERLTNPIIQHFEASEYRHGKNTGFGQEIAFEAGHDWLPMIGGSGAVAPATGATQAPLEKRNAITPAPAAVLKVGDEVEVINDLNGFGHPTPGRHDTGKRSRIRHIQTGEVTCYYLDLYPPLDADHPMNGNYFLLCNLRKVSNAWLDDLPKPPPPAWKHAPAGPAPEWTDGDVRQWADEHKEYCLNADTPMREMRWAVEAWLTKQQAAKKPTPRQPVHRPANLHAERDIVDPRIFR